MNDSNLEWTLQLKEALASDGHYEVHFPNGEVKNFSWKEFHRKFKVNHPWLYKQVIFRWVSNY